MMMMRRQSRFNRRVYRAIHPEFKLETGFVTTSVGLYNNYHSTCLNVIDQGDGQDQRSGNRVCIKQIKIRLQVYLSGSNTADYNAFRVLIVKFKPADNRGNPDLSDILNFGNSGGNHMTAFRNLPYIKQFKVIKDTGVKKIGAVGGLKPHMTFNWYIKANSVSIYTDSSSSPDDISQNLYALYMYSDQGENWPNIYLEYNTRFLDC